MKATHLLLATLVGMVVLGIPALADETDSAGADTNARKYALRYQFHPGETIRWEVLQQAHVKTTLGDATQITETVSKSVKAWRVTDVAPDGVATFEHLVESVDMRQELTGHPSVRYNSLTDEEPPPEYQQVPDSIGVPLCAIKMSTTGEVLDRVQKRGPGVAKSEGQITIPLPEEPVAVGHKWSFSYPIEVPLENGTVKKVDTLQQFALKSVKTGVATIEVATRILTPIHDPAIEAKLIQRESAGTVRFDVDAGRVIGQQMDLDRRVVGFSGDASSLHYVTRFTEKLLPETPKTAGRPD